MYLDELDPQKADVRGSRPLSRLRGAEEKQARRLRRLGVKGVRGCSARPAQPQHLSSSQTAVSAPSPPGGCGPVLDAREGQARPQPAVPQPPASVRKGSSGSCRAESGPGPEPVASSGPRKRVASWCVAAGFLGRHRSSVLSQLASGRRGAGSPGREDAPAGPQPVRPEAGLRVQPSACPQGLPRQGGHLSQAGRGVSLPFSEARPLTLRGPRDSGATSV